LEENGFGLFKLKFSIFQEKLKTPRKNSSQGHQFFILYSNREAFEYKYVMLPQRKPAWSGSLVS